MNLTRPLRSSGKIWLAISIPLFIACWFIPIGGKGGGMPIGGLWWIFITLDYTCSDFEMLTGLAIPTFVFAAGAALVGWILQFFVCMTLDNFQKHKHSDEI
jgi:hypothetical protein